MSKEGKKHLDRFCPYCGKPAKYSLTSANIECKNCDSSTYILYMGRLKHEN